MVVGLVVAVVDLIMIMMVMVMMMVMVVVMVMIMMMVMIIMAVVDLGAVALVRGCLRRKVAEPLEVGPACTVGLVGSSLQSSYLWTTCQA